LCASVGIINSVLILFMHGVNMNTAFLFRFIWEGMQLVYLAGCKEDYTQPQEWLAVSIITYVLKVKLDCTKDILPFILYLMIHEERL